MASQPNAQITAQQQNMLARQLIMSGAVEMVQQIFSQTVTPSSQSVVNVQPRNVGLIKGFWVEVTATIQNGATNPLALTDFNVANILSGVTFNDLDNNTRIQTTGWHLEFVNTSKQRRIYGSAVSTDSPIKYGSNFNVISAPSSIAASATGTVKMVYWVPLAYSHQDYRGAIWANVTNANMNLQLTINANAVVASGDSTSAVYSGNTGSVSSCTVSVYQCYMDQLPRDNRGVPILPLLDLATAYELKFTTYSAIPSGQDFPMQYSNFRDFLSSHLVYFNGTARTPGTDINYLALQSANFTNIFKVDPFLQALRTRNKMSADYPNGVYYFDYSGRPVSTNQYGNMELILNPSTAGAGAYAIHATEDFALRNVVTQAGSLAS